MSQEQKEYEDHASTSRHASNSNNIIYIIMCIVRIPPRVSEEERARRHNAMMIFDLYTLVPFLSFFTLSLGIIYYKLVPYYNISYIRVKERIYPQEICRTLKGLSGMIFDLFPTHRRHYLYIIHLHRLEIWTLSLPLMANRSLFPAHLSPPIDRYDCLDFCFVTRSLIIGCYILYCCYRRIVITYCY